MTTEIEDPLKPFIGSWHASSIENLVPYCKALKVGRMLLSLAPLAPLPYMTFSFDDQTGQCNFRGSFKVGPFEFGDDHFFTIGDESVSKMRITNSSSGNAVVNWEGKVLVFKVVPIPEDSAGSIPQGTYIMIRRYINEEGNLIGDHKLYNEKDDTVISYQVITWQRKP